MNDEYDPLAAVWNQDTSIQPTAVNHPDNVFSAYEQIDLNGSPKQDSRTWETGPVPSVPALQQVPESLRHAANPIIQGPTYGDLQFDDDAMHASAQMMSTTADFGTLLTPSSNQVPSFPMSQPPTSTTAAALRQYESSPAGIEKYPAVPSASVVNNSLLQKPAPVVVVELGPALRVAGGSSLPGLERGHVEYSISTRTTLPSWSPTSTVKRRFKDIVQLAELLACHLPGVFIPGRPHRSAFGSARGDVKWLEGRRSAVQRYLSRCLEHPAVRACPVMQVFLQCPVQPLSSAPAWQSLCPPPPPGWFSSTTRIFKQAVGQDSGLPSPRDMALARSSSGGLPGDVIRAVRDKLAALQGASPTAQQVTPLEQQLREAATKQEELRLRLSALSAAAKQVSDVQYEVGGAMTDLGRALQSLADYEQAFSPAATWQPSAVVSTCLFSAKEQCCSRQAHSGALLAAQASEAADDCKAAQVALARRERSLLDCQTLEAQQHKKQQAKQVAEGAGPGGFAKAQALSKQVEELQVCIEVGRSQYQQLCHSNAEEVVRWKQVLARDACAAVMDLVQAQAVAQEAAQRAWSQAVADLQKGPGNASAASTVR